MDNLWKAGVHLLDVC